MDSDKFVSWDDLTRQNTSSSFTRVGWVLGALLVHSVMSVLIKKHMRSQVPIDTHTIVSILLWYGSLLLFPLIFSQDYVASLRALSGVILAYAARFVHHMATGSEEDHGRAFAEYQLLFFSWMAMFAYVR